MCVCVFSVRLSVSLSVCFDWTVVCLLRPRKKTPAGSMAIVDWDSRRGYVNSVHRVDLNSSFMHDGVVEHVY